MMESNVIIEENSDEYGNFSRMWILTKDSWNGNNDVFRVHSGTEGPHIWVKGCNNGHMLLTEIEINLLIKELKLVKKSGKWMWGAKSSRVSKAEMLASRKLDALAKKLKGIK